MKSPSCQKTCQNCLYQFVSPARRSGNSDHLCRYTKILDGIKRRCSGSDYGKISRLFSWLLCHEGQGQIPLPKQAARIGMAFYPGKSRLAPEDVPFAHATDFCKPLVEDGPHGSLTFIHSTVTKYVRLLTRLSFTLMYC